MRLKTTIKFVLEDVMNRMLRVLLLMLTVLVVVNIGGVARGQTKTKIVDHGPDGEKLTFVVLGDGYAKQDQDKFAKDVDRLVVSGVFAHDFYRDNFSAFNVYRVNLVSEDSGVSHTDAARDTALKVVYSGDWNRCWLEESDGTDQLIVNATAGIKADFVLIMANEGGYGGCQRGGRLYITSGDDWDVVAHEYGHGIGGLYDEYWVDGAPPYSDTPTNVRNCSTVLDIKGVSWRKLIAPGTPLPTDDLSTADPNVTVGMFTGCDYAPTGIFRPVKECRMKSNTPNFCPVCLGLMKSAVAPYLGATSSAQPSNKVRPSGPVGSYVNMVIRINKEGPPEILRATQLKGSAVTTATSLPSYLFAFTGKGHPSFAKSLPDDPFIVRGFVDPQHKDRGEKLLQSKTAVVSVTVPETTLSSVARDLSLQVYSVKPSGAAAFMRAEPGKLDSLLEQLKASGAITLKNEIPASKFSEAVKSVQ
jgi:IgA Peptidase M64